MNRIFIGIDDKNIDTDSTIMALNRDETYGYVLYNSEVLGEMKIGKDFISWLEETLIEL